MDASTVMRQCRRWAREHIGALQLELLKDRKTGELTALAVPAGWPAEQDLAVGYLRWVLPAHDGGVLFALEDVTNYGTEDR